MRVFVYEYTCSTSAAENSNIRSLHAEGWAMLTAVLEDFAQVASVTAVTLLAEGCPCPPRGHVVRLCRADDEKTVFRQLAQAADYTLVIAPECDEILATRCQWVEDSGGQLLGPTRAAVGRTADKLALAGHLQDQGVPTPPCQLFQPGEAVSSERFPLVWKPCYGAGSQATFLVRNLSGLPGCAEQARREGFSGDALLQPFVLGRSASVAVLIGPRGQLPLPAAAQHLSSEGRFHYLGGSLPLPPEQAERAQRLATQAVATVSGLRGYVGVDLVLGEAPDGSQDWVIEINPRLTTSYVGLRALADTNLAEILLRLVRGEEIPKLSWRRNTVHFEAGGRVWRTD
jgi:predicted ATP-grasp superfamily ATP-dependent carboligase